MYAARNKLMTYIESRTLKFKDAMYVIGLLDELEAEIEHNITPKIEKRINAGRRFKKPVSVEAGIKETKEEPLALVL